MKIKCIDNSGSSSSLTLNKYYNVTKQNLEYFEVVNEFGEKGSYSKSRFEIVENNNSLPIRWCIQHNDENRQWVKNKHAKITSGSINFEGSKYYIFSKDFEYEDDTNIKPNNLPELTLEDLKEHFKDNIIGYIAPFDMYENQILKGEIFIKSTNGELRYCPKVKPSTPYELPKEIVEQWEPVYRPAEKTLYISSGKVVVKKDGVHVDNSIISINEIKSLLKPSISYIGNWSVSILDASYKIGCWKNITKKDLDLIIEAYDDINI